MERRGILDVATALAAFIEDDVLPPLGLSAPAFWHGMATVLERFMPRNAALLADRDRLQRRLDAWHDAHRGTAFDIAAYRRFLGDIGYLVPDPMSLSIDPGPLDREIAVTAAPQLVVPVLNARYTLNAANARWNSLYDALYGTDAILPAPVDTHYDPVRGQAVIAWGRDFLDRAVPLRAGSWHDFAGGIPDLARSSQWVGRDGDDLLFVHHGLHIVLVVDRDHPIGTADPAGIADIRLEAALTTIVDMEDSVAAVDAEDKVACYANWLALMRGDLEVRFVKGGRTMTRTLSPDRRFVSREGTPFTLPGRALLLVRNVGHLMTSAAVRHRTLGDAPEGIVDGIVTALAGLYDLRGLGCYRNSRAGALYIVKPKMHGPAEAAFANDLFDAIEDMLDLDRHTIKIGLMDEERRTSANLGACIHALRRRLFFINTGFLDRTGDEIHSTMRAGPMVRKSAMKAADWITAYEDRNVQIGLACGLSGKAQIGKGMWAAPDRMADMLAQKIAHPMSGASTAWVPSPTATTLHATHYHTVDVAARQEVRRTEPVTPLDTLLTVPVASNPSWSAQDIAEELDNNCQGILGYVVRWIDQGIGCSKVPDLNDIGLMEDRATLRISSQHIANWLLHGICDEAAVTAALTRMAARVDAQNAHDPDYRPMATDPAGSRAFQAARALIFGGTAQPNGYTEPVLHRYRHAEKAARA